MLIERIELRLLDLPLVEPFVAAHGTTTRREIVVARVDTDVGHGWGECSALPEPTYNDEFASGAFVVLDDELAPRLVGHDLRADDVVTRLSVSVGNPMAKAALEMAVLDAELRAEGRTLADAIGATSDRVPAGVAVGLGSPEVTAERVVALAEEGFRRVKVKIAPGSDLAVVDAVLTALDDEGRGPQSPRPVAVQVDGNGAFAARDLGLVIELASSGVSAVEQPLPAGDVQGARRLVEVSPVPIVADEAAVSLATVERLSQQRALSAVSVKPSRLGGLLTARRLTDWAAAANIALTAGGMVETGLGRHALAALAALPEFTIPGDQSPARRWLAVDPWPDLAMVDGHLLLAESPGVAPDPDMDLLNHHTVKRSDVTAAAGRR